MISWQTEVTLVAAYHDFGLHPRGAKRKSPGTLIGPEGIPGRGARFPPAPSVVQCAGDDGASYGVGDVLRPSAEGSLAMRTWKAGTASSQP